MPDSDPDRDEPLRVLIAGGGVAGLESVMALRALADDRVEILLVAPDEEFVYRPLTVGEPFALGPAKRLPLSGFAREFGAALHRGGVASVEPDRHAVVLDSGERFEYDKLLVAVGAQRVPAYEHAATFRGQEDVDAAHGLVQDVEMGYSRRIAFVVPPGVTWSLPLYELALMTARRAWEMSIEVELTVVTPEERPLAVFGGQASADTQALLENAGIAVRTSVVAEIPRNGVVIMRPGGDTLEAERVVALPVTRPIPIAGLPTDADGYLPIDPGCRVGGAADVYAAGDGTNFPVKQGGIACQQADVAAENIAREAGVAGEPATFRPVLRGQLLTGDKPQFMQHDIAARAGGQDQSTEHLLWWPPAKVAGRYLGPYLEGGSEAQLEVGEHDVPLRAGNGE